MLTCGSGKFVFGQVEVETLCEGEEPNVSCSLAEATVTGGLLAER